MVQELVRKSRASSDCCHTRNSGNPRALSFQGRPWLL